jgi:hypothetical protein
MKCAIGPTCNTQEGTRNYEYMKYAVKIGSGDMIYLTSFTQIGSGIQKLMRVVIS